MHHPVNGSSGEQKKRCQYLTKRSGVVREVTTDVVAPDSAREEQLRREDGAATDDERLRLDEELLAQDQVEAKSVRHTTIGVEELANMGVGL